MAKHFENYIKEQLEAAGIDNVRMLAEAQAEEARQKALLKEESLANTIRAFAMLGIEVEASDLEYDNQDGYGLVFNGIRLGLGTTSKKDGFINWLKIGDYEPRILHTDHGDKPRRDTSFTLHIRRVLPAELLSEDGEYPFGFHYRELWDKRDVRVTTESNTEPVPEDLKADIHAIFSVMNRLEVNYQSALATYQAHIQKKPTVIIAESNPRFTYSGESREAILAQLLRDIANPPKEMCSYCGRQAVDPISQYCLRCGADVEL